jgi:LPXTG-motif cell wall-anchored protein
MTTLIACAVCFGASDSLQFKGMQMGILVLLGVTGCMLAAFAAFFLYLRRRQNLFDATEGVTR